MKTILFLDDHTLFRAGIRLLLNRFGVQANLIEAGSAEEGIAQGRACKTLDLILLDLHLPGLQGLNCVRRFRDEFPIVEIVILSGSEDKQLIQEAIKIGAKTFIHKSSSADEILTVLRPILEKQSPSDVPTFKKLSPRKAEVLSYLCAGNSNKQIARELDMSDNTVRVHLHDIFKTLGVSSRVQAVMRAKESGWF